MSSENSLELTPQELSILQESGEPVVLLDVREPNEWALTRIEGATLIPMGTVPSHLQAIEGYADEKTVVVYCHHGVRSLQVVSWLRAHEVPACYSLAGGIDRWSREIDPTVPTY